VTALLADLYLDEDVSVLVGNLLRARGFRNLTTRDAGRLGQPDSEQMEYATSRGMAILSQNRVDFQALHQAYIAAGLEHAGVKVAVRHRPYELTQRLLRLLNRLSSEEMRNQIIYI
jgi:hypothetical protein